MPRSNLSFNFKAQHDLPLAVISDDSKYRYFLSRSWAEGGKSIAFVGLNPSTADAINDDPTIRRCIGFAKSWGGSTLLMVNLFAYRATRPADLFKAEDPVGPENDLWLNRVIESADLVVAAWGNHGTFLNRAWHVANNFKDQLYALAVTKMGMPSHPLYLPATASPKRFLL